MIRLKEITNENIFEVCSLKPFDEQKDFVADNTYSLAEAYATKNSGYKALPLAIYDDNTMVGFVMIGFGTVGDEDEPNYVKDSYCLWRFMIDKRFQGKGLSKPIMDEVMKLIKTFPFGKAEKVWLSYDKENERAKKLYMKYGFKENGDVIDGEVVAIRKI